MIYHHVASWGPAYYHTIASINSTISRDLRYIKRSHWNINNILYFFLYEASYMRFATMEKALREFPQLILEFRNQLNQDRLSTVYRIIASGYLTR